MTSWSIDFQIICFKKLASYLLIWISFSRKLLVNFWSITSKISDAKSDASWKSILIYDHKSYMISEFSILVNENHICSFTLIFYLTHYMQFLDVEVFQPYKHWHQIVIQKTISKSFVKYSLNQFLKDLAKIQINTFKASTIWHAFEIQKCNQWMSKNACKI